MGGFFSRGLWGGLGIRPSFMAIRWQGPHLTPSTSFLSLPKESNEAPFIKQSGHLPLMMSVMEVKNELPNLYLNYKLIPYNLVTHIPTIIQAARRLGQPLAFDFFCGGGGASMGLLKAGFTVIGVDNNPAMLRGHFQDERVWLVCADALEVASIYGHCAELAHYSPPCQDFSSLKNITGKSYESGGLLFEVLELAPKLGNLYCIENVPGSARYMPSPFFLCGCMFPSLNVYRRRAFQTNFPVPVPPHAPHTQRVAKAGRPPKPGERLSPVGHFSGVAEARLAMGMDWGNQMILAQAIPVPYMEYIGQYARRRLLS